MGSEEKTLLGTAPYDSCYFGVSISVGHHPQPAPLAAPSQADHQGLGEQ